MNEHPIKQTIRAICVIAATENSGGEDYIVGRGADTVTRIEACEKSGMYSSIPYVRVWSGDNCLAEFCQHNIVGVYFADPEQ